MMLPSTTPEASKQGTGKGMKTRTDSRCKKGIATSSRRGTRRQDVCDNGQFQGAVSICSIPIPSSIQPPTPNSKKLTIVDSPSHIQDQYQYQYQYQYPACVMNRPCYPVCSPRNKKNQKAHSHIIPSYHTLPKQSPKKKGERKTKPRRLCLALPCLALPPYKAKYCKLEPVAVAPTHPFPNHPPNSINRNRYCIKIYPPYHTITRSLGTLIEHSMKIPRC
ncbi:hypothetical protein N658DRAFT_42659 [Parathielavia hyrcaniae]|uniref:Uncharacterized protein n=1 Tax=Parathielavia hyrcaniae TaxID=113614 RepID=A0AAN6Q1T0_9PEZI|nr:hypothetical protein N658DRAFT_42659 [Parathielavia hyrcaniae]